MIGMPPPPRENKRYYQWLALTAGNVVVYLTWKTHELPTPYLEVCRHNEAMNPEYRFVLYTDEDLNRLFAEAYLR